MEKWTGTGFALPTRKSVAEKLGYNNDSLRSALVAGLDDAIPWQLGKYPAVIVNNFENQFLSALLGEQSLKQAMLKAQNNANQQMKMME
jgi:multiple sugar transport system substrate-binding protein